MNAILKTAITFSNVGDMPLNKLISLFENLKPLSILGLKPKIKIPKQSQNQGWEITQAGRSGSTHFQHV